MHALLSVKLDFDCLRKQLCTSHEAEPLQALSLAEQLNQQSFILLSVTEIMSMEY
jgi:hypothetical protein